MIILRRFLIEYRLLREYYGTRLIIPYRIKTASVLSVRKGGFAMLCKNCGTGSCYRNMQMYSHSKEFEINVSKESCAEELHRE